MFTSTIKSARLNQKQSIKELAQSIGIDPSLLSRIERGERVATEDQVKKIAINLGVDIGELMKLWLQDKVENVLTQYPDYAGDVLLAMESRIEYLTGKKCFAHSAYLQSIEETVRTN